MALILACNLQDNYLNASIESWQTRIQLLKTPHNNNVTYQVFYSSKYLTSIEDYC